jgi:alanyl-tRNA synthetase
MLVNFSIGDYVKQCAMELSWELSLQVFGFSEQDIWVTVFAGDEALGLGPDEEAIELWQAVGVPRERIVGCPRSENFWEAGPVGPSGPCSELYIDRGPLQFGAPTSGSKDKRFLGTGTWFSHRPTGFGRAATRSLRHQPGAQPAGGDPTGTESVFR